MLEVWEKVFVRAERSSPCSDVEAHHPDASAELHFIIYFRTTGHDSGPCKTLTEVEGLFCFINLKRFKTQFASYCT